MVVEYYRCGRPHQHRWQDSEECDFLPRYCVSFYFHLSFVHRLMYMLCAPGKCLSISALIAFPLMSYLQRIWSRSIRWHPRSRDAFCSNNLCPAAPLGRIQPRPWVSTLHIFTIYSPNCIAKFAFYLTPHNSPQSELLGDVYVWNSASYKTLYDGWQQPFWGNRWL